MDFLTCRLLRRPSCPSASTLATNFVLSTRSLFCCISANGSLGSGGVDRAIPAGVSVGATAINSFSCLRAGGGDAHGVMVGGVSVGAEPGVDVRIEAGTGRVGEGEGTRIAVELGDEKPMASCNRSDKLPTSAPSVDWGKYRSALKLNSGQKVFILPAVGGSSRLDPSDDSCRCAYEFPGASPKPPSRADDTPMSNNGFPHRVLESNESEGKFDCSSGYTGKGD